MRRGDQELAMPACSAASPSDRPTSMVQRQPLRALSSLSLMYRLPPSGIIQWAATLSSRHGRSDGTSSLGPNRITCA